MSYNHPQIDQVYRLLSDRLQTLSNKSDILKAPELKGLFSEIKNVEPEERASFGKEVNDLRLELEKLVEDIEIAQIEVEAIDVTAPIGINEKEPSLLDSTQGSRHPLTIELQKVTDIFYRMGFNIVESREIDDDYHMFASLNFPEGHPARDDYDTFMTKQTDKDGKQFIAPAHTSSMQNRVLREYKSNLEEGRPIAALIPGRVFRNEDVDARHEHTFYQLEGVYVDENINAANLIATLKTFLEEYYQKDLEFKTQPYYFPFTEPSFEFTLSCPFCDKKGCSVCSYSGWIELLGCGMIHPEVLHLAGIDTEKYTGFAWGCGLDRLVMMKYDINDVRNFHSAKLEFLRMFK